jgi:nitrile hydratase beta subunit
VAAFSDMGGRTEHFGPIVREPNEPVFHARWESRVFGIAPFVAALFGGNVEAFRYAMERLPREVYMSSYYGRWLAGFEDQLVRAGYLGPDELDARVEGRRAQPGPRRGSRARVAITSRVMRAFLRPRLPRWVCAHVLPRLIGTARPALRRARFAVGDRVQVRADRASRFTRQPGYVAGKPGVVAAHQGAKLFADAHALHRRARPQHLYTVAFDGSALWGPAAEPDTEVRVDLFESYLERT